MFIQFFRRKYTIIKEEFDSHSVKCKNVIFKCAKFNMQKQEDGETVDNFIAVLYKLVEDCNYGLLREEMICIEL